MHEYANDAGLVSSYFNHLQEEFRMPINLKGRSFLTLKDFSTREIQYLLDLSLSLKEKKRSGIRGECLAGKSIALIFEKPSTRTRCAFTVACIDEGGHPEYLGKNDIQLGHKESVKDTARVLGRMFDGIQYRGFKQSVVEELALYSGVPVWNGLTDMYHPTQILADFLTLKENFGKLKGLKFVYVGDGRNNMANSLMIGSAKMGIHFRIAAPGDLFPEKGLVEECQAMALETGATIEFFEDPVKAVKGADAIYTDVWASMGEEDKLAERVALLKPYQVNSKLMEATGKPECIFLHCLPAVKGNEVTEDVFESSNSKVFEESENRLHTIKAVMVSTAGNI
jgi:ornithine carbamoyltransferase